MALKVADTWFELHHLSDGVTLIREANVLGGAYANMWHVRGRDRDLLLDSGMGVLRLREHVACLAERPVVCVASHTHFDHIGGHHEFEERLVHGAEAGTLETADPKETVLADFIDEELFQALPYAGFDPRRYTIRGAKPTRIVEDGDMIDLGDRTFEVQHLPGHSPGSITLWEATTQTLLSGDVVCEGTFLDALYRSDVPDYIASLERIRDLPVAVVHPGHYDSFGRERFGALIDDYIAGKRKPDCPAAARS